MVLGSSLGSGACAESDGSAVSEDDELVSADPARIARTTFTASPALVQPTPFISHPDYLAVAVPTAPAQALLGDLDRALGAKLKSRGEAHITVLTPPEVSVLAKKLPMRSIEALADAQKLQQSAWTPMCLGVSVARSNRALQTYYVVVKSDALFAFRRELHARFVAAGGAAAAFDPADYRPHVTLGFTQRDLFEADGAQKTPASCPRPDNLSLR